MPDATTRQGSEFNQNSFLGGMNLLGDDSRLNANQYRIGFNLTNRYDVLDPVLESLEDFAVPPGIKQKILTFGNFIIVFVSGFAYYRFYLSTGWTRINGFQMSTTAPKYWTQEIPLATTNYLRIATESTLVPGVSDSVADVEFANIAGAAAGNIPGLLVQDNINQPQFIFLNINGVPEARTTQSFDQWFIQFTDASNTVVAPDGDKREYVPIGSSMAYEDGILYITSQDGNLILPSVSGRPLDFVRNVTFELATTTPFKQLPGGDAYTTAYSVGVGGIVCLRAMSTGGIFVAASNANFLVTKNYSPNAPKQFGEYTFIRTFLFNSTCLSDRVIFDTIGDTRFIDLNGVRSFNAIQQVQNEGRNQAFSATIQGVFTERVDNTTVAIIQDATKTAAILFDNYELYALNTIFGPAIAKFDTLSQCWVSFDVLQTDGKAIKEFAKIELSIQRLYAITEDDRLFNLYIGPDSSTAFFRTIGICASILYADSNIRLATPKNEVKLQTTRAILNNITEDCNCSFTPYINNRKSATSTIVKEITFEPALTPDTDLYKLNDVDTLLMNLLYSTPNCEQGWKVFGIFTWTGGSFTQFSMGLLDNTPMNPPNSQESAEPQAVLPVINRPLISITPIDEEEPVILEASFEAQPLAGVEPLTVQFTDTSEGNIISWEWDFDDGNTSTEQSPQHVYVTNGTYNPTLTVTNDLGMTDAAEGEIIVTPVVPPPLPTPWVDLDARLGIVLTSGLVSEWQDQSGNGRHFTQSVPGFRPSVDVDPATGFSYVNFGGAGNGYVELVTANLGAIKHIFMIAIFPLGYLLRNTGISFGVGSGGAGNTAILSGGADLLIGPELPTNEFKRVKFLHNGPASKISVGSGSDINGSVEAQAANDLFLGLAAFSIVSRLIIYDQVLTGEQELQVQAQLLADYGI